MDKKKKDYAKWVEAARAGDKRAFANLYATTYHPVYFYLLSMTGNPHDAEDLTQSTFMLAMERLHQLKDGSQFPAWLNRIAYSRCMDFFRVNKRQETETLTAEILDGQFSENTPVLQYLENDRANIVMAAVMALPQKQRSVILLKYYEGLRIREIAEIMDCSEGTVKSRLNAAKKALHFSLRQQGITTPFLGLTPALSAVSAACGLSSDKASAILNEAAGITDFQEQLILKAAKGKNLSLLPMALSAVGILAFGAVLFASESVPAAAETPAITPETAVVSNIQLPAHYAATALVSVELSPPESVSTAYLKDAAGQVFPLSGNGTVFTALVSANGLYTLYVEDQSGKTLTNDITINTVDNQAPEILTHTSEGDRLTLSFADDLSGVDMASVYAISQTGDRFTPEAFTDNQAIFNVPPGDCTIYYQDKAGNEGRTFVASEEEQIEAD